MSPRSSHLYLMDGTSYIYRAFFAIRQALSNSKGLPTNAIYGFTNMLSKFLREEQPDYLAIAFDPKGPTVRHEAFAEYKAHRPAMPSDLALQIPYIFELVRAYNIPLLLEEGYEADDVLGSVAKEAERRGFAVTIVSGDKDMLQLVSPQVRVLDTMKDKVFQEKEVWEKFGVKPVRVVDVLGLMGDSSDNIPGVPGIGQKTAAQLINQFDNLENLFAHLNQVDRKKLRDSLHQHRESALLSKRLATIVTDLHLPMDLEQFGVGEPDKSALFALFKELEFSSLLKSVSAAPPPPPTSCYQAILEEEEFRGLLLRLREAKAFALEVETSSQDPVSAEVVGVAVCLEEKEAYYIPLAHEYSGISPQLPRKEILFALKPVLEDEKVGKYIHEARAAMAGLASEGIHLDRVTFDTMIASYLLNPSRHSHDLEGLSLEHLGSRLLSRRDAMGSGAKAPLSFQPMEIQRATQVACQEAEFTLRLTRKLAPMLKELELEQLFSQVELPLIGVLADMERHGVKVDGEFLGEMSKELEVKLEGLMVQITSLAGTDFNINSPKQLAEVLFDKLGLKPIRRNKTGYSTDVAVLEELALHHDLPALVLSYRQLAKLKSTYVDALPALVHPRTGRTHTSFNQAVTATGRLSSSNPNLQNIPTRTSLGREIRRAFIAEPSHLLLSADYSQIELRILAHLSEDELLLEAFSKGEDVHCKTAAEVFGVRPEAVTHEMRRAAKTVNFGIIYGLSPYGLARDLNISQQEARKIIEGYFSRYRGVREFLDRTIQEAHQWGYVTTLCRRRRYLPDLRSRNRNVREFAERTAINTPIQGAAADLIKLAMLRIHRDLSQRGLLSRMTLQVHDELLFEVPRSEVQEMVALVREGMEGVMKLKVPLVVDISLGPNWGEMERWMS